MNKLPFLIAILLSTGNLFAQLDSIKPVSANHHLAEKLMLRSKKINTTGWVLLSGGLICGAVSFTINPNNSKDLGEGIGLGILKTVFIAGGIGLTSASIPLFIVSGVKKRKANLLLANERVIIGPQFKTNSSQLKTGLAINF